MPRDSIPPSYLSLIETAGGSLLESDPGKNATGWVITVSLFDPKYVQAKQILDFFFAEEVAAKQFYDSAYKLSDKFFDGFNQGEVRLSAVQDRFSCSFCGRRRSEVNRLIQGLIGPSICDSCVKEQSAKMV